MGTVVRAIAAVALVVAGVVTLNPTLIYAGVSIGSTVLLKPKVPKASPASADRLTANIDPRTPRKFVFGQTALATDIRDQEFAGDQEYLHRFIVVASHAIDSVDEIWFDDRIVWASAGGVQGEFVGYLEVAIRTEGTAGNAINIGARMGASRRYTGLAYVHLRYKLTGNTKKAESPFSQSIASRMTIVGRAAKLYDPRLDSTRGGSGSQRVDDQSTWAYNPPGVNNGRNPALHLLWYLLGWRINGKLAVGKGIPVERIDIASFITAANLCDEAVALAAGGTERRYQSDGIFSEGDNPTTVIDNLKTTMNATLDDMDGKIRLNVLHNDLASPIADFGDDDILGEFTWDPTAALQETYNIVRGTYVDASSQALYQMVDYPEVKIDSPDGIDRIQTLDLPMVQSASQAQRLAKQWLQRAQYGGTFSAEFQATAWKVQKGDVIRQSFKALGWTNKLFRVADTASRIDGIVPMVLREENADIYAWDAEDSPPVEAADPTTYDPLLDPIVQAVGETGADGILTFNQEAAPTDIRLGNIWYVLPGNKPKRSAGPGVTVGGEEALIDGDTVDAPWYDVQDEDIIDAVDTATEAAAQAQAANVSIVGQAGSSIALYYTGVVKPGQLPKYENFKLLRGDNTDLTTFTTWSAALKTGSAAFVMGLNTGILEITSATTDTEIEVTASYSGVTKTQAYKITLLTDAAPASGGSVGSVASTAIIAAASSSSYAGPNTEELIVTAGATGQVMCTFPSSFWADFGYYDSGASGKWQWATIGGSFADVAAEVGETFPATSIGYPEPFFSPGWIGVDALKTGLTPGTSYRFRLLLRSPSGPTLNFNGTATATGQ